MPADAVAEDAPEFLIHHANLVTETGTIPNGWLLVKGTRIADLGAGDVPRSSGKTILTLDAKGAWLLPGFVDVHVHGGGGADFMDAEVEAYDRIAAHHVRHGTTSLLATTVTASKEAIDRVLQAAHDYQEQPLRYARLAGVHLEGPFLNEQRIGAQNPAHLSLPQEEWLEEWLTAYPGLIRLQTLAPELPGAHATIRLLTEAGVTVSAGHTDATCEEVLAAADAGLTHGTHCFNAMSGLHHREPGAVGAVLSDDRITAELIADGHHVHEAVIRLVLRAKGADKVALITDAMSASGLGDGRYELGGLPVEVTDGVARIAGSGALAGSTLTMLGAFRFAVQRAGATVEEASRMASGTPARQIGQDAEFGSLAIGKRADLLLLDESLALAGVWVDGKPVA
ncbi:N-acetylglucosamine-6-phosphate deacetylase [Gorillibacterium sp. CAU 1737]|uniref:N-acetylglucosamine-6-phosphate deacetylase n=1 Tax=Gorillibacterium sp. CAU 1737 TaxID=3140362 RepID=UPI0032604D29